MIHEIIHQMWIPPNRSAGSIFLPNDVKKHTQVWRDFHPSFEYKLWSLDAVFSVLAEHNLRDVSTAIHSCRFPAAQADIARLAILQLFGGFWADLKLVPKREFLKDLTHYRLVVTEHFPKDNLPIPNGFLINSFIGSEQAHPVISDTLERVIRNVRERKSGSIFYVTGSTNLLEALKAHRREADSYMLPHQAAWGELFDIGGVSYNEHSMHWSIRETREPMYVTLPNLQN